METVIAIADRHDIDEIRRYGTRVGSDLKSGDQVGERARRREARKIIAAHHDEQLRGLLEHVRDGFARRRAGAAEPP